jgi:hypothetical protein
MRQWIKTVGAIVAVLVFAVAYAAILTVSGEVIKYEVGKSISVRDLTGNVLALDITKDTKVEGDVKVGVQVSIEADGKKAQSVKVAAASPGPGPGG